MIRASVTGRVWATRRLDSIPHGALLECTPIGSSSPFVALDTLGCGVGEEVLVVQGSVASAWFGGSPSPPIDALVIGSVDASDTAHRIDR